MASNPFDCNQKKSAFGSPAKAKAVIPREPVTLVADKNQIITAIIPYNSPQAAPIRQHMHSNITIDGQRVFIFRPVNGWTNIALNSTAENPKLTADPITVLKLAHTKFSECPSVSSVSIKWAGTEDVKTYEDIDQMEPMFTPLPESQDPVADGQAKTEGEFLMDKLNEVDKKVDDKILELGKKIDEVAGQMMSEFGEKMESFSGRMDELIDSIHSNAVASISSGQTPTTESRPKKRARKGGEASGSLDLA
jgi:hypothetical protein